MKYAKCPDGLGSHALRWTDIKCFNELKFPIRIAADSHTLDMLGINQSIVSRTNYCKDLRLGFQTTTALPNVLIHIIISFITLEPNKMFVVVGYEKHPLKKKHPNFTALQLYLQTIIQNNTKLN
jgi:hypothetical protein